MFDGEVFGAFGFGEQHAIRVAVELMRNVRLSLERGMLTDPNLTIEGRGGSWGWGSNPVPDASQEAALQDLATELQAAIERRGPR